MRPAPVRGAGLMFFLSLLLLGGCTGGEKAASDPEVEAARELGLARGARLHRVVLGGRGAEEHVLPQVVRVDPGDAVEFVTVDHRIHRLEFPRDSLAPEAYEFLRSTGSEASPPLPFKGSRFLLLLEGAPLGRYPFLSHGHGGTTKGVIEVTEDSIQGSD